MRYIFTFISLLIFSFLHAQNANLVWAKQLGGTLVNGVAIAVDALGNVYTTGDFTGTADFNPDPAVTFNLTSAGNNDIFISKIDAAGNFVWAKRLGGTAHDYGQSIAVDALGNVYSTGYFAGTADFNPDPAVTNNLTSAGGSDIFVSKLNTAGTFVWAKRLGGTQIDNGFSIAVDIAGNVYTTGAFTGTADFNPDPAVTNNLSSGNFADIFVSKLDASGSFVWAKNMGGSVRDEGHSIAVDASGNVYTTGYFNGAGDFNPDPAVTFTLTAVNEDIFISKLNASGNFVWAKQLGGPAVDHGNSIALDASANVYSTGSFRGTADFDPDPAVTFNLTAADTDIFISKLDASGNFVWARKMGGPSAEFGNSITVDVSGVYLTGQFLGTVDFNPDAAVVNNLTSAGNYDIFISKLDAAGNFVWAKRSGGTLADIGNSIAVDVSGNLYSTGVFQGIADLDPDAAVINNFTSSGTTNTYIIKLSQSGTSLPVSLSGFTIQNNNCIALLKWTTATQQNSKHFEVQYSSDGVTFTTISTVPAGGNSNAERRYSYSSSLVNQNNYFRLRIVDLDGSSRFSAVESVISNCMGTVISLYPNPAKNRIIVNGLSGANQLRLLDNIGRVVTTIKTTHQTETLAVSNLPAGTYTVQVVQNNKVIENFKVIKK